MLAIGIGGSALGPMFVGDAWEIPARTACASISSTTRIPTASRACWNRWADFSPKRLCIVTSKSGGTPDTRNGMVVVADAYRAVNLNFARHAVAVTMAGSHLDELATSEKWLARFPMFDWVGGRISELSAVGLLPAALQGIDIDAMLAGAADCDAATRVHETLRNPAALLALMWYVATDGKGKKDMVVLPYKDRLLLFSRYLQQLVMESLGKQSRPRRQTRRPGNRGLRQQGLDRSARLRAAIARRREQFLRHVSFASSNPAARPSKSSPASPRAIISTAFWSGTREALYGNDRQSMTITIRQVNARTVGALIALFERAVGLYASLIHINAYNQPGVEAGKKAAADVLALQAKAQTALSSAPQTADQIASAIGAPQSAETVYLILEHLSSNGRARMARAAAGATTFTRV